MDINCTDNCMYQSDGKCGLTDTPVTINSKTNIDMASALLTADIPTNSNCPYFYEKKVRTVMGRVD